MTAQRHTMGELVEYAYNNKRGKAFCGWTRQNIMDAFLEALQDGTLLYSVDDRGRINGVVHGTKFVQDRTLFIGNILSTGGHLVLVEFIKRFKVMFQGYNLEAQRRGKRKIYNTGRLVQLLTKT